MDTATPMETTVELSKSDGSEALRPSFGLRLERSSFTDEGETEHKLDSSSESIDHFRLDGGRLRGGAAGRSDILLERRDMQEVLIRLKMKGCQDRTVARRRPRKDRTFYDGFLDRLDVIAPYPDVQDGEPVLQYCSQLASQ